jgi:hypothetical protein
MWQVAVGRREEEICSEACWTFSFAGEADSIAMGCGTRKELLSMASVALDACEEVEGHGSVLSA